MDDLTLLQNRSECITHVNRFGYYEYYNLCKDGLPIRIDWGYGEWIFFAFIIAIFIVALAITDFVFMFSHRIARWRKNRTSK
jgi:hypothetical protein